MVRISEEALADIRRQIEEEPSHGPGAFRYPGPLSREIDSPAWVTQRYRRYESTKGYVNVGTSDAEVIDFSGVPDSIEIWVLDNDVLITFVTEEGAANEVIQVNANNFYEPGIVYRRVLARNVTAGLVGRIQVVAKWAYL